MLARDLRVSMLCGQRRLKIHQQRMGGCRMPRIRIAGVLGIRFARLPPQESPVRPEANLPWRSHPCRPAANRVHAHVAEFFLQPLSRCLVQIRPEDDVVFFPCIPSACPYDFSLVHISRRSTRILIRCSVITYRWPRRRDYFIGGAPLQAFGTVGCAPCTNGRTAPPQILQPDAAPVDPP